ncbi:MAG: hypothetical protein FJ254_07390 [Phycisphaerae bacterium]|nr:hypothetical protein [Phycisphaerae bacterium]
MQRRGKATLYELMRKGIGDPAPSRSTGGGFSVGSGAIEPRRPWKAWALLGALVAVAVVVVGIVLWRDGSSTSSASKVPSAPSGAAAPQPAAKGTPASGPALSQAKPALPAAAGGDPRKAGLNYLVVLTGATAPAGELTAFLRGKGLDAWQVSGNNAGLSKVIVLPASTTGSDQAAETLKNQVKDIGRLWKATKAGNPDLSDCYYEKFKG